MSTIGSKTLMSDRLESERFRIKIATEMELFATDATSFASAEEFTRNRVRDELAGEMRHRFPVCVGCPSLQYDMELDAHRRCIVGTVSCKAAQHGTGSIVSCNDGALFTIRPNGRFVPLNGPSSFSSVNPAEARRISLDHHSGSSFLSKRLDSFAMRTPREIILQEFVKLPTNEQIDLLEWLNRMTKKRDEVAKEVAHTDKPMTESQDTW